MSKNHITVLIALFVFILAFAFYWYSYRPEQIRKKCYDIAVTMSTFDINYKSCLLDNGIDD